VRAALTSSFTLLFEAAWRRSTERSVIPGARIVHDLMAFRATLERIRVDCARETGGAMLQSEPNRGSPILAQ
jgi:hypothetical protein